MRRRALVALALTLAACEGRSRTKNSAGGGLSEAAPTQLVGNVYRFVTIEQTLSDARKALKEERWGAALGAAQALLKQQPGHLEAQKIAEQSSLEVGSQAHFDAFAKAVAAHDSLGLATHFRALSEGSVYVERARPEYERTREQWVA